MDIDRNKINEMKSECLQMPDYIRDMIEETVEQQLKKKQRYGKKMWRVAAAILAFACVGGGSNAAGTIYHYIDDERVRIVLAEAGGKGIESYTKCIWSSRGNMALH